MSAREPQPRGEGREQFLDEGDLKHRAAVGGDPLLPPSAHPHREARAAMYEQICGDLDAAPVQHIGKLLVLYRPKVETVKERSSKAGKGMREVTIVKASASGTKKPSVTKVMIKGNERVTAGGNIKRAKPRQASTKKNALNK